MQYSKFRPADLSEKEETVPRAPSVLPGLVVGFAFTASLLVLLLLTQSQLSQMSFRVSELERQLEVLEVDNEKLRVAHAKAYSLERIERAARELGMVRPGPQQYVEIDIEPLD